MPLTFLRMRAPAGLRPRSAAPIDRFRDPSQQIESSPRPRRLPVACAVTPGARRHVTFARPRRLSAGWYGQQRHGLLFVILLSHLAPPTAVPSWPHAGHRHRGGPGPVLDERRPGRPAYVCCWPDGGRGLTSGAGRRTGPRRPPRTTGCRRARPDWRAASSPWSRRRRTGPGRLPVVPFVVPLQQELQRKVTCRAPRAGCRARNPAKRDAAMRGSHRQPMPRRSHRVPDRAADLGQRKEASRWSAIPGPPFRPAGRSRVEDLVHQLAPPRPAEVGAAARRRNGAVTDRGSMVATA